VPKISISDSISSTQFRLHRRHVWIASAGNCDFAGGDLRVFGLQLWPLATSRSHGAPSPSTFRVLSQYGVATPALHYGYARYLHVGIVILRGQWRVHKLVMGGL